MQDADVVEIIEKQIKDSLGVCHLLLVEQAGVLVALRPLVSACSTHVAGGTSQAASGTPHARQLGCGCGLSVPLLILSVHIHYCY
jgi:hypothetical protein